MDNIFEETEQITEKKQQVVEIPQAYQICTTDSDGRTEIIDTLVCNRIKGIVPKGKAEAKARMMKQVYPKKVFYVVEILHRIVGTY